MRILEQVSPRMLRWAWYDAQPKELEPPVCELHDWRPVLRPGQPRPHKSMCPDCVREADRKPVGPTVYIGGGSITREVPQLNKAYAHWLAKRPHDPRNVRPGSIEEAAALQRIDENREKEERRNHPNRHGVAYARHGEGFIAIRRHARRGARMRGNVIEV